jgi:hypothetical protein
VPLRLNAIDVNDLGTAPLTRGHRSVTSVRQ